VRIQEVHREGAERPAHEESVHAGLEARRRNPFTASGSKRHFLQVAGHKRLVELASLFNPEARMDERELTTDAHPWFYGTELFLGAVRRSLDKEVAKRVVDELPKDLSSLKERELERYFSKRA
jgi:hypothetical protein